MFDKRAKFSGTNSFSSGAILFFEGGPIGELIAILMESISTNSSILTDL